MKYTLFALFAGLVLGLISGCSEDDPGFGDPRTIVGTGPVITKELTLDAFSRIENSAVANIYVTLGSPQSVVLKAQQNIIDVMNIGVFGDELRIELRSNTSIDTEEEIRFDITVEEITSVELLGVGDFILSGEYQDALTILLTGVGFVKAFDLEVGTCNITITGAGSCEVNVRDELLVDISGVGNVTYIGQPSLSFSITGVGELIDAN
jgi:hypothetical protein